MNRRKPRYIGSAGGMNIPLWIKNQGVQMSPSGRHDTQLLSDVVSDGKFPRGMRRALRYPVC